jgi:hypothetical protein
MPDMLVNTYRSPASAAFFSGSFIRSIILFNKILIVVNRGSNEARQGLKVGCHGNYSVHAINSSPPAEAALGGRAPPGTWPRPGAGRCRGCAALPIGFPLFEEGVLLLDGLEAVALERGALGALGALDRVLDRALAVRAMHPWPGRRRHRSGPARPRRPG